MRQFKSHGSGNFTIDQIAMLGSNVIFEKDICIWHPETVSIGNNVYIGHRTMLKGHPKGKLSIANNVWIGQNVFIHSAGSVDIQSDVGIGPSVQILTSSHQITPRTELLLNSPLEFEAVCIETGAD
ncbi:MAG: hypothetical protein KDD48_05100, partial [Bdellovibrionales bacterium]|nr:hypothetical protein [Bdellovibrionales bacterium]